METVDVPFPCRQGRVVFANPVNGDDRAQQRAMRTPQWPPNDTPAIISSTNGVLLSTDRNAHRLCASPCKAGSTRLSSHPPCSPAVRAAVQSHASRPSSALSSWSALATSIETVRWMSRFINFWPLLCCDWLQQQGPLDLQACRLRARLASLRQITSSRLASPRRHRQGQTRVTCRAALPSNCSLSLAACPFLFDCPRAPFPEYHLCLAAHLKFPSYCILSFAKYPTLPVSCAGLNTELKPGWCLLASQTARTTFRRHPQIRPRFQHHFRVAYPNLATCSDFEDPPASPSSGIVLQRAPQLSGAHSSNANSNSMRPTSKQRLLVTRWT